MCFFLRSQGSFNQKIMFSGHKVCSVASSRIGPIKKGEKVKYTILVSMFNCQPPMLNDVFCDRQTHKKKHTYLYIQSKNRGHFFLPSIVSLIHLNVKKMFPIFPYHITSFKMVLYNNCNYKCWCEVRSLH